MDMGMEDLTNQCVTGDDSGTKQKQTIDAIRSKTR